MVASATRPSVTPTDFGSVRGLLQTCDLVHAAMHVHCIARCVYYQVVPMPYESVKVQEKTDSGSK